jgi:hypothetical protein
MHSLITIFVNGIEKASFHCRDLKQSIFVTLHPKQLICIENDTRLGRSNIKQALYKEELLCNTVLYDSRVLELSWIVNSIAETYLKSLTGCHCRLSSKSNVIKTLYTKMLIMNIIIKNIIYLSSLNNLQ